MSSFFPPYAFLKLYFFGEGIEVKRSAGMIRAHVEVGKSTKNVVVRAVCRQFEIIKAYKIIKGVKSHFDLN